MIEGLFIMKKKISLPIIALVLSVLGFLTGWMCIGVLFNIIAFTLAVISFATNKEDSKILNYLSIGIAVIGTILTILFYIIVGLFSPDEKKETSNELSKTQEISQNTISENIISDNSISSNKVETVSVNEVKETVSENVSEDKSKLEAAEPIVDNSTYSYNGKVYKIISVDGGNLSGSRQSNVAVDIGYGDRVYWGLTNEYGQLVYVIADKIIIQNDSTEPVNADGRYYDDEAAVQGTEDSDLDQGHVIADSLGGVSNAYNITPQNSTLNRYGDQAYMEKVIRDAGGCENFIATITYPDTTTQIPSSYKYEYLLKGNQITDEFPNENPEDDTTTIDTNKDTSTKDNTETAKPVENDIKKVDTDRNGTVTIKEAKAAGYSMPIHSDHWLYPYMIDRDGDGMVGE